MNKHELTATKGSLPLLNVLKDSGLTPSMSESKRMVMQKAVRVDGHLISDVNLTLNSGFSGVIQVGKRRFAHVEITD